LSLLLLLLLLLSHHRPILSLQGTTRVRRWVAGALAWVSDSSCIIIISSIISSM
jgi:hypothetical protein